MVRQTACNKTLCFSFFFRWHVSMYIYIKCQKGFWQYLADLTFYILQVVLEKIILKYHRDALLHKYINYSDIILSMLVFLSSSPLFFPLDFGLHRGFWFDYLITVTNASMEGNTRFFKLDKKIITSRFEWVLVIQLDERSRYLITITMVYDRYNVYFIVLIIDYLFTLLTQIRQAWKHEKLLTSKHLRCNLPVLIYVYYRCL